jgi:hypothetical protein
MGEKSELVTHHYQAENLKEDDEPDDEEDDGAGIFGFVESDAMKIQGNRQLEDAIKLISLDAKAAYMEALKRAPNLVATESDPIRFLRFEKYNAWAAARRLVTYWSSRKSIFGENAFLPLDLSGKGALDEGDLAFLNSGCAVMLPSDNKNRSVICIDRSKTIHGKEDLCIRPLFFLLSAASENEMSQREGCIGLVVLNNPTGAIFHRGNVNQAAELIRKALPLRLEKCHLLCCPPEPGASTFKDTFIPKALRKMGKFFSRDAVVHAADTEAALFRELLSYGLARKGLPSSIGGAFGLDKFVERQEQRGLVVKKNVARSSKEQPDLAAIIRETLANYSAQLGETQVPYSEKKNRVDVDEDDRKMAAIPNTRLGTDGQLGETQVTYSTKTNRVIVDEDDRKMAAIPNTRLGKDGDIGIGYHKEAEKHEILCDVPFTITKAIQEEGRARSQLEAADLGLIPDEQKAAYLEARERSPHPVELGSDPRRYLWNDNTDPWVAAQHLSAYWGKFEERAQYKKSLYSIGDDSDNNMKVVSSQPENTATSWVQDGRKRKLDMDDVVSNEVERRAKKRRLDALYARRKRERHRVEVEVLQDQCRQLYEKNRHVATGNKRLEAILAAAKDQVEIYERVQVQSVRGTIHAPARGNVGSSQQIIAEQLRQGPNLHSLLWQRILEQILRDPNLRSDLGQATNQLNNNIVASMASFGARTPLQYPPPNAASRAIQTRLQGSSGQQTRQFLLGQLPSAPRAEVPAPNPAAPPTTTNTLEILAILTAAGAWPPA